METWHSENGILLIIRLPQRGTINSPHYTGSLTHCSMSFGSNIALKMGKMVVLSELLDVLEARFWIHRYVYTVIMDLVLF